MLQVDGYAGYDPVARLKQDRQADAKRPGGPLVLDNLYLVRGRLASA